MTTLSIFFFSCFLHTRAFVLFFFFFCICICDIVVIVVFLLFSSSARYRTKQVGRTVAGEGNEKATAAFKVIKVVQLGHPTVDAFTTRGEGDYSLS